VLDNGRRVVDGYDPQALERALGELGITGKKK
jgi:hypothetical protein